MFDHLPETDHYGVKQWQLYLLGTWEDYRVGYITAVEYSLRRRAALDKLRQLRSYLRYTHTVVKNLRWYRQLWMAGRISSRNWTIKRHASVYEWLHHRILIGRSAA